MTDRHHRNAQDRALTDQERIRLIVHKAEEGGFWAEVPSIPGRATQGETMEEIEANAARRLKGDCPSMLSNLCFSWTIR